MRGWGAPLVASAFWAGLLLWDLRPAAATTWPWWLWVVLGGFALAGAVATAPGRRSEGVAWVVGGRGGGFPRGGARPPRSGTAERGPCRWRRTGRRRCARRSGG